MSADSLWVSSKFAQTSRTLAQPVVGQAIRAGFRPPSYPSPTYLPNTPAQPVCRAGKKPKSPASPALNFVGSRWTQPLDEGSGGQLHMLPSYHARQEGVKTHPKTNLLKITRLLKITPIEKDFVAEAFFLQKI